MREFISIQLRISGSMGLFGQGEERQIGKATGEVHFLAVTKWEGVVCLAGPNWTAIKPAIRHLGCRNCIFVEGYRTG